MGLQHFQQFFIHSLEKIYPGTEAENIWWMVLEKALRTSEVKRRVKEDTLLSTELETLQTILKRLLQHEPVQYIINECWFYDLPFFVNKNVLIPRPETEELAEWIIKENKEIKKISLLDIGSGSGCIPIILKRKIPQAEVYGCDISHDALVIAKNNAAIHCADIQFFETDFTQTAQWHLLPRVDIIVSNPPYIPEREKKDMQNNVLLFEPHLALFVPDEDPLVFYKAIVDFGKTNLNPGGKIYMEIHEPLAAAVVRLFRQNGFSTTLKKDMQQKNRMIKATNHAA